MHLVILGLLVAVVHSRTPAINPNIPEHTTRGPEDITVKSNENPLMKVDAQGQPCQCLPYYHCNANNTADGAKNISVTGYGSLNISFPEDSRPLCSESQEVCCATVKDMDVKPNKPTSDPKKIKGCGYRNPKGIGAYFNGPTTQFGEFPWVVALLNAENGSYVGMGALIHPQVVLTAAHAAYKYVPDGLKIRAGEWDTQTTKEIYDYQERAVEEIYIHLDSLYRAYYSPLDFNERNLQYDIALLRLERPVELAEHINIICMPEQDEVFDTYKNCVANGWGKKNFGQPGHYSVTLNKVEVDMMPHSRCNELFRKTILGNSFDLHETFLCAGVDEGEDNCLGDGGAPLACPIGNDRYKLTGLVAWAINCGKKDIPAGYTNVPKFRKWVDRQMEDWGFPVTPCRSNAC